MTRRVFSNDRVDTARFFCLDCVFYRLKVFTMRLIQNMSTIAEYPNSECGSNRVIKLAVLGGSGVGKTGERMCTQQNLYSVFALRLGFH